MGTVFFIVLLILTPAQVTLSPSGKDVLGVVFLNFAATCNREAYEELLAFSTNFSCNAHFNHLLKNTVCPGPKCGLGSITGFASSLNLN